MCRRYVTCNVVCLTELRSSRLWHHVKHCTQTATNTSLCIIDSMLAICNPTPGSGLGTLTLVPPLHRGFGLDSLMLGFSPLDCHAAHTAALEYCFDQLDDGPISLTVHALISVGGNTHHCMAPQSLSKLTLPPCLPAAPPSPTPPSASQICLLRASVTQL